MLSLPGLKGLIKTRDHRQQSQIDLPSLFDPGVYEPENTESLLAHLAAGLDLEILALIETRRNGKAAGIKVAGRDGGLSDLTLPALDMVGALPDLVTQARPAAGRAKLFARGVIFPTDDSWCDLIPMDSVVSFAFFPLAASSRVEGGSSETPISSTLFLLVAAHLADEHDPGFIARALASAGLVERWITIRELRTQSQTVDSLTEYLRNEGYSVAYNAEATAGEHENRAGLVVTRHATPSSDYDSRNEKFRLLSRFMSSVAHEIKNPLTGISAGVQYLAKKLQPGLAQDETVEFILAEISRLNRIVDDLYKIAKPPELVLMPINLNDVVAKSLLCLSEMVLNKRLTVRQDLHDDIPQFEADPDRLQQILINIVKNAIEATPDKGEISIETWKNESRALVRITDSGPGIPDEAMARLFEPFYSTKEGGTGLGLCISQRIIDEHRGSISVERPESGGTSFVIELPLKG